MALKGRIVGLALAACVAVAAALVSTSAPAQAASAYDTMAAKARQACGYSYIVKSKVTGYNQYTGSELSRLFVLYGNGYNCAVHVKYSASYSGWISVALENDRTGTVRRDSGNYHSYAGPVYVYAPNDCVTSWGALSSGDRDYTVSLNSVGC
ncbi:MAG: hypothetical protein HOQ05_13385 [Corynebacteriales bacterium]|nr:hypothetical protein [Mycobacteriales bacterium]